MEIEDDEILVNDPSFVTLTFGGMEPPFTEGDGESTGIPILLSLAEPLPQSDELHFQLLSLDGTAKAGEDYVRLDVRLTIRQGELVVFDPSRPLLLKIVADRLPEAVEEHFYLSLSATLPGLGYPLFSQLIRVGILDDDHIPSVTNGQATLWLGALDPLGCPAQPPLVEVDEPPPGSPPLLVRIPLYARLIPVGTQGGDGCGVPGVAFDVNVQLQPSVAGVPAALGQDVSLAARGEGRLTFAPVEHLAVLELLLYADELLESDEHFDVRVSAGVHGDIRVPFRLVDYQKREALQEGREASVVRLGRMLGAALTDALSGRFSCARSAGCSDPARSEPLPVRNFLRRLASAAAPFTPAGSRGAGLPGLSHPALELSAVRPFERTRLQMAGRMLDDLTYQSSPSAWLPVRNPADPNPWSTWFRTDYVAMSDTDPAGNRLETDLLSFSGGVDRRIGMLNLGILYSYAQASYGRGFEPLLAEAEAVPALAPVFRVSGNWHVLAPYIGVTPHDRLRLWSTFGTTLAGVLGGPPGSVSAGGYLPAVDAGSSAPAYRIFAAGTSITAFRASSFIVDLEADVFRVRARLPTAGTAAAAGELDPADRARVAVRVGLPLDFTGVKRITFGVGRRWDAGPDLAWVRGTDVGVGQTEVLFDARFATLRSRFSASLAGRVQLTGWNEPAYRAPDGTDYHDARASAEHSFAAALRWGISETPQGWSIVLRPSYGYPGLPGGVDPARSLWYGAAIPREGAAPGLPAQLDLEAHYLFGMGGRLVLSGSRSLVATGYPSSYPVAAVRFDHGW